MILEFLYDKPDANKVELMLSRMRDDFEFVHSPAKESDEQAAG